MAPDRRDGRTTFIAGFELREAMLLTVCAVLLVSTKVFFRLKLGVPGHSAVFLAFCLILGRMLVDRTFSATFVGVLAGLGMMALGLGKAGPLAVVQTVMPGLLVDLIAMTGLAGGMAGAACLGLACGLGRGPAQFAGNLLVGMQPDMALIAAALKLVPAAIFGAAGGAVAFFVTRRLIRGGLLEGT